MFPVMEREVCPRDSSLPFPGSGPAAVAEAAGSGAGRPGGCEQAAGGGMGPTLPGAGWPLPGLCGEGEPGVCLRLGRA